jgi:hypothetical protein
MMWLVPAIQTAGIFFCFVSVRICPVFGISGFYAA